MGEFPNKDAKILSVEDLKQHIAVVRAAQKTYASFSQQKVDEIFKKAAIAANDARIELAKFAVEETGMGIVEDKVIKNHFASEYIYNKYKDEKTCGVIESDAGFGFTRVAEPIGVIAAVVPTTNPTSTAIFKALLALKTRNGIIFAPHPRAKKCTVEAARIVLKAAVKAGAPENIIAWIEEPTVELSGALMQSADLVLATGGPGMIKAAYSSGKPAIGVGAGNTPAIIDETSDVKMAVNSILLSKSFDNGVICASEQAVLIVNEVYQEAREEFAKRGGYLLKKDEIDKVRNLILIDGKLNAAIVGQSALKLAEMAGISVPKTTKVLIGEVKSVEADEPFAYEKLSPILAMYKAKTFDEALEKAKYLVEAGGLGHTSVLYTDPIGSKDRITKFSNMMKTGRIIINTPSSHGAIGDVFNFRLEPSLTLGCGSWGGNSISENVGVKHLLNIKNIAERRENMLWFRVPERIYFKYGCLGVALKELKDLNRKRAFIVTDKVLFNLGYVDKVTDLLDSLDIKHTVFYDVLPDPTLEVAIKGAEEMKNFEPDVVIALGGGSPIDAAKIMWTMYEHPDVKFEDLALRFMDIRKRVCSFPTLQQKAMLVAIPTTAGTGSEVTPFAVITDDKTGIKYPLADYELTPKMAIVDTELMMNMPKGLTAASGIDALTHAIESYVSIFATEFTNGLALEAIKLIFDYLPKAYSNGTTDVEAREKMAHASTIAGMAFSNAFLGICHSLAHKLGSVHHLPHGVSNGLLINEIIRFNAVEIPTKQAAFAQYKYPNAIERYAKIADYLELGGKTEMEKVELLIAAIDDLKWKVAIPKTIQAAGVDAVKFYETLDKMSEQAFDDQCTGANPRYPLIEEIKRIYINAYEGIQSAIN